MWASWTPAFVVALGPLHRTWAVCTASRSFLTAWRRLLSQCVLANETRSSAMPCSFLPLSLCLSYLFPPLCHLICLPSHLLCILLIFMSQQLVSNSCISINQSNFGDRLDGRKGEVTGLGRSINSMGVVTIVERVSYE